MPRAVTVGGTRRAMNHVAFFRNTNLGRPHSPSRSQLEQAFLDAGASAATSFLTNGTLAFATAGDAVALAQRARERLTETCGLREPVFLRSLAVLRRLVGAAPFAGCDTGDVYECCASFLPPRAGARVPLPLRSARGDVEVLARRGDVVFALSRKFGASPGSPNALLERTLGTQATTRNWNTVVRLVAKFG
jgi:uncharacterized protein (DUF1697 family)